MVITLAHILTLGGGGLFALTAVTPTAIAAESEPVMRDTPGGGRLAKDNVHITRDNLDVASPDADPVDKCAVGRVVVQLGLQPPACVAVTLD
jgi:hypothetical protein